MRRDSGPPLGAAEGLIPIGEAELIRRCLAGERAAFERFYRDHRRAVAASLYRMLGDAGGLDGLVQEVFVLAFRGLERFRGDAKLSTWLTRICVHMALARLRNKARRGPAEPYREIVEQAAGDETASPEQRAARREQRRRVYVALDTLAPKKRVAFVLHEIEGLDIREIAAIVRAPPVVVRARLQQARMELYRRIAEQP